MANVRFLPRGDQVPPHEEDVNNDQASVNPPPLTDENKRDALLQIDQPITTQYKPLLLKPKPL